MKAMENIDYEIEITTFQDILDNLTDDNFERFFYDFALFINQAHKLKKQFPDIKIKSMLWKDDGVHEITAVSINDEYIKFTGKNKTT